VKTTTRKCENMSSGTLSSNDSSSPASESDETTPKKKHSKSTIVSNQKNSKNSAVHEVKATKTINRKHDNNTSSSDSDSTSEDSNTQPISLKAKASSSSSSSEDSDSEPQPQSKSKKSDPINVPTVTKEPASYLNLKVGKDKSSISSVQGNKTRVTKKRRMDTEGNSVATTLHTAQKVREQSQTTGKTGNDARTTTNRFTRVDPSKSNPSTVDNSYVAKVGYICSVLWQLDISMCSTHLQTIMVNGPIKTSS
jgi:hypothetical protein